MFNSEIALNKLVIVGNIIEKCNITFLKLFDYVKNSQVFETHK